MSVVCIFLISAYCPNLQRQFHAYLDVFIDNDKFCKHIVLTIVLALTEKLRLILFYYFFDAQLKKYVKGLYLTKIFHFLCGCAKLQLDSMK